MNARNMSHLRQPIRNQDRVRRMQTRGDSQQVTPEEMRHCMAQANLRARRLAMLQMPEVVQGASEQPESGGTSCVGVWGSHRREIQPSGFAVRPLERTVRVRSATPVLSHFTTRKIGNHQTKMWSARVLYITVAIGSVLAASINPTIAAAPEPDVRQIMGDYLDELKIQWKANEKAYQEEQARIHAMAEKARKALCDVGEIRTCKDAIKVFVTSYNPLEAQTDASPCHGAGGNVCDAYKQGKRPIALSQDLIATLGGGRFRMGDTVEMQGGNCTGTFTVLDTMNARWTNRADIFFPDRSQNVGCTDVFLVKR